MSRPAGIVGLDRADRLALFRLVCTLVWADRKVQDKERAFVRGLVRNLRLAIDEIVEVERWLKTPPPPEDFDPRTVPLKHRKLFLDVARATIASDGEFSADEVAILTLLEQLTQ